MTKSTFKAISIFWFRRDLRLQDNKGLWEALNSGTPILPLFIFDTNILSKLENRKDARVNFIYDTVLDLKKELEKVGSSLLIEFGTPEEVWKRLFSTYTIQSVYCNHDYEEYAIKRDNSIQHLLQSNAISFHTFKDHVIFEKREIAKDDGSPYTVFTPYSKKWKETLNIEKDFAFYDCSLIQQQFLKCLPFSTPPLSVIGFEKSSIQIPSIEVAKSIIKEYKSQRDFPCKEGTSKLGIHFRFGTISIREKAKKALFLSETFLNELIWRDFYAMILANFPKVAQGQSFKKQYDLIEWRNNEKEFQLWCNGQTGFPIVDAGMRQLNETGWMHNRVRMIVASFLTKNLLIDWRWGEAYFAERLLDYDFASNNGGWQWASGSGTDAAPYFRVFNPITQQQKFDPNFEYVKQWIPDFSPHHYIPPIVDLAASRKRCLEVYQRALKGE